MRFTAICIALINLDLCATMTAGDAGQVSNLPSQTQARQVGNLPHQTYRVGVAQVDITPSYPVRLSGFGFRRTESEGIAQRIWAKALALDDGEPAVLIAVDNLGVPASLVHELARRLQKKAGLKPERLAVTATHTHTAPMLQGAAPTLFGMPIPKKHQEHIDRYTAEFANYLERAALAALADRQPARLTWGVGKVEFAKNRRTKGGPVDHDLPVLVVRDLKGKVRAVHVNYACHCVTLSSNKISGDWAGYAQALIQQEYPGAVALVSIGCGADQNPSSGVTGDKVEIASRQGDEIAREVKRLLGNYLAPISGKLIAQAQRFELPLDVLPSRAEWEDRAKKKGAAGYHAQVQLARLDRGEKLRNKIDYSVQTWAFGDSMAMVFLPGEVVVDYALRLKRELDGRRLWLNAYANDAPCYIPSERVLKEGGYEGATAMLYYDVPTRFKAGLEQQIIDSMHKQIGKRFKASFEPKKTGGSLPLSPQQALATLRTKNDLVVELMAAEPLITAPVAIDWGPDGKLWVAEMNDYPSGEKGDYKPGGRIKFLEDTDGDGIYDKATLFLDNIPFPTGVTVWRKGVLVCAAPDILYAEDTDGDGKADVVRKLFSGFGTENYQARVNSLEYGLDNWVHGSCGIFGGKIRSFTGAQVDLGNRDFRILPDKSILEPATGRTQQGRVRDDWGNWFGCDNTTLCRHYPLADHYLRRNPYVIAPPAGVLVPDYPDSNHLFPLHAHIQLFKLSGPPGRTTAACGLGVYRDDLLGREYTGNTFTCEPVNLLVHRLQLSPKGSTFSGRRARGEEKSEFLASTDTWFRPVQVRTGPDGALWVVDMYRFVIEHPRWIPPEDLAKVDVRAGSSLGRIYRVRPRDGKPRAVPRLDKLDAAGLVAALDSANGWQRDLAGQMLLWRNDKEAVKPLEDLAVKSARPEARLHALCVLDGLGVLDGEVVQAGLADPHAGVRRHAIRLSERFLDTSPLLGLRLLKLVNDPDAQVRLQLAYSLGAWHGQRAGLGLSVLALEHGDDPYLAAAVLSSVHKANIKEVLAGVLAARTSRSERLLSQLVATAIALGETKALPRLLRDLASPREGSFSAWQLTALAGVLDALQRRGQTLENLVDGNTANSVRRVFVHARVLAADGKSAEADRLAAIGVLGREAGQQTAELTALERLLVPQNSTSLQSAAVNALARIAKKEAARVLIAGWKTYTPALKSQVLDILLERQPWQLQLLAAIEAKTVSAAHIDAGRRQRLLSTKSKEIRTLAAKVFAGAVNSDRQKVLDDYRPVLATPGDIVRGKAVFAKKCASCHRLHDVGFQVGPDLASVSTKTPLYLLTEILDPNRNIDSRYLEYLAVTKAGRTFTGLLASESSASITLRGQEGKDQVFLRMELESFQSTGKSLMPEGMERDLSRQELADLIGYLTAKSA